MKIFRLFLVAAIIATAMGLVGCGGGGGSSAAVADTPAVDTPVADTPVADAPTSDEMATNLSDAYAVLETAERTALTTFLYNSTDTSVQGVMSSMSDAAAGGLDSTAISTAYTDSLSRANPFVSGVAGYDLFETLADAIAALRANNVEAFNAYATLVAGMDDTELAAIVTVLNNADAAGYTTFNTFIEAQASTIVAAAPAASDSDTVIATIVATGLGGSGTEEVTRGSTNTPSLEIASRVSVVDSTETALKYGNLNLAKSVLRAIGQNTIDAWADTVDYNQDVTQVWVNDRSSESFGIINEILCSFEQTRFDSMINRGAYIAQIDVQLCEQKSADNQSASQAGEGQTSVTVPEYEYWVIDSVRESADGVQVVYAWIPNEEDYGDGIDPIESVIMARMVIYKGVDEYPPYGLFTINFKQVPFIDGTKQIDPNATSTFKGILKSFINTNGDNLISFSMDSEMPLPEELFTMLNIPVQDVSVERSEYVIMETATDGSSGRGATYMREYSPDMFKGGDSASTGLNMTEKAETFNIAFNDSYFLREDVTTDQQSCYERQNPKRNVYRYGLYDANGARVNLRSGVPIGYTSGGRVIQGWAGFWGIWIDGMGNDMDMSSLDGQVVSKFDWATNALDTSEQYTINVYPGKLRKIKRNNTTLDKIKNVQFSYWENSTGNEYRIEWDGTGFLISALRDNTNWTWNEDDAAAGSYLDLSNIEWPDISVWSEALNGSVRIDLNGKSLDPNAAAACVEPDYISTFSFDCSGAPSVSTPVIVYKEKIVEPGSSAATAIDGANLTCYNNCPDPSADANNPYFQTWIWNETTGGTEVSYTYQFDSTDMVLKYNGTPVLAPESDQDWNNSIWSGALISGATLAAYPDMLDCPWDDTQTCGWMAESNAPVFFRWESGADSWNKLISLVNNQTNQIEQFDQPLNVDYTHTYADNSTKTFVLNYEGFGNLHGIPETCEDGDTGNAIDCPWLTGNDFDGWVRVISEFAIAGGSPATYFDPATESDVDVVIKPLEEEHFLRANASTDACTADGLTITDFSTQFVSVDGWKDPAASGMGAIPLDTLISTDPFVIAGEVVQ